MLVRYLMTMVVVGVMVGPPGGHASLGDKVNQAKKFLNTYIDELQYIEEKEEQELDRLGSAASSFSDAAIEDAWKGACNSAVSPSFILLTGSTALSNVNENLREWNMCLAKWMFLLTSASWNYETNLTPENAEKLSDVQVQTSTWQNKLAAGASLYLTSDLYDQLDDDTRRQIRLLAKSSVAADPENVRAQTDTLSKLQSIYSQASVDGLNLEPGLTKIMAESRNGSQLLHVWQQWLHATGPPMKPLYVQLVDLLNQAARDNKFENYASLWIDEQFDNTPDLESMAEQMWSQVEPLYQQLHAYVRHRLRQVYPEYSMFFDRGVIPAHILGNMNAQEWSNIYDLVKPYPEVDEPDYNVELQRQGYTVDSMFSTAEQFFLSLGLAPMTPKFNKYTMKVRPDDREVVCHASASDFYTQDDFRIKMCTEVNMEYFETIHHEMGHIEYFMEYAHQPTVYRNGANSAFHEAIGDTISLSVMSRSHLNTLHLTGSEQDQATDSKSTSLLQAKRDINFLLKRALFKVAFLPFGYMIDRWRFDVFKGLVDSDHYNGHWWRLILKYQGLVSPVQRSEEDFDPASKFHIPTNSPYICYFFSFISQFQFYEAMCEASGHQGELYKCDFYNSKEAGDKLRSMLRLGMSKPWPEAMEILTGSRNFDTASILRYFKPLYEWLRHENQRSGAIVGWGKAKVHGFHRKTSSSNKFFK